MNKSSRHHYIPKFLVKNFADSNGLLHVYDKSKGIITHRSPKSIFFEWNRNTFKLNGKDSDMVETAYSALDNMFSQIVGNLINAHNIDLHHQIWLTFFALFTKWRIPKSDGVFDILKENISIDQLGAEIRMINSNKKPNAQDVKKLVNSDVFKEMKRILFALQPFMCMEDFEKINNNSFVVFNTKNPALIGDCGINEKNSSLYESIGEFVFPLGSYITLVYKNDTHKKINSSLFFILKDILTFHSSKNYVACSSKKYLEQTIEMYNILKIDNSILKIEDTVFKLID